MSAPKIIDAFNFDANSLTFSKLSKNPRGAGQIFINGQNKSKVYIRMPYMRAPFALSEYTDETSKRTSYSINLSFNNEDPELCKIQQVLEDFDTKVIKMIAENSVEILGQEAEEAEIRKFLYRPLIRKAKKGDYAPTMKLKVYYNSDTKQFGPEIYNQARQQVPVDSIEKGQRMAVIFDLCRVWIIDGKISIDASLHQAMLEPGKKLPPCAFDFPEASSATEPDEEVANYED